MLDDTAVRPRLLVASKSDLGEAWGPGELGFDALRVSAPSGTGLDALRLALVSALSNDQPGRDTPAITNLRHIELLEQAREALGRAERAAASRAPEEFVAADVSEARGALEEITGKRTADDTLQAIFSRFCIGK